MHNKRPDTAYLFHRSPWIVILAAAISPLVLDGCDTFRMYSEVRDKQGTTAKTAWGEVDLKGIIATERTNLNKLLEAELDAQDRLAAGVRNFTLRAMVDGKNLKETLVDPLEQRLDKLVGKSDLLTQSLEAREKQRKAELDLASFAPDFESKNVKMPNCAALANDATPPAINDWLRSASETDRTEMTRILREIRGKCISLTTDADVYGILRGELNAAWTQYKNDSTRLATSREQAAILESAYLEAVKEYDKAIAVSQTTPEAAKAVQDAKANFDKALAALEKAQDALSVSFLSKERIKSIEKLVVAITETTPGDKLPADTDKATVAFLLIPGLIDDARQALAHAKTPLAIPLLMRRNYEQLNLEAANRDIASREATVRLSRDIVVALYQQALQIRMAYNQLDNTNIKKYYADTASDAFSKPPPDDRELIYSAAALYLDALNRLDAKRYKLEYMRIAAIHERSLAYAEVNMQQWQSLIGVTVDQVADFNAGGIKPETIGNLINTVGILAIGAGVIR